ncbi:hypothetical protein [Streptomyces sp. FIT100]|uniref:hypothetical protein n=1 Tax=Streptomyces sp. FIT100 TaxID=2837956 RepID=UPI0021CAAE4E|nr:hypothetical protein [Streptomyces sp. FIT100]UUN29497.1 hypothetical protein KK483_26315 [Streptomyces sp. FIT100]
MERTGTTRRRALMATGAMAAAAALTGCASGGTPARPTAPGPVSAETALRRRSTTASAGLLARYDAVLIAHPGLAARLAPLRAEVARHVKALAPAGARGPAGPSPAASATAGPSASAAPSPAPVPVSGDARTAVQELAAAEQRAADAHAVALSGAPPEYARLLASVAAAGAVHVYLLTEGAVA